MKQLTSRQVHDILESDVRAVACLLTEIENSKKRKATSLLKELFSHTGEALVIGVTGSPGVGKSTLVNGLAHYYSRAGEKVGVIAVDPSSPFSGGAILGDRIRMQSLATDPNVFVRSMAKMKFGL